MLSLYQSLTLPSMPIGQPTLAEIGRGLLRLEAWREAAARGHIVAYLEGNGVRIVNRATAPIELPLTGTVLGEEYGGRRSGWISAAPGTTFVERATAG